MTQRLSSAKESSNKPLLQSHEDMARKLQVTIWSMLYYPCVGFSCPWEAFKFVNIISWLILLSLCKRASNADLFCW